MRVAPFTLPSDEAFWELSFGCGLQRRFEAFIHANPNRLQCHRHGSRNLSRPWGAMPTWPMVNGGCLAALPPASVSKSPPLQPLQ